MPPEVNKVDPIGSMEKPPQVTVISWPASLLAPLTLLALLLWDMSVARAQDRHGHASMDPSNHDATADKPPVMVHAGLHFETGRAQAFGAARSYQGVTLMARVRRGRFALGFHLPLYRIELGSTEGMGLGDVHVSGRWTAWQQASTELGISAGYMPPVGDDEDGIGMGHSMIMAGGFARASRGRLTGRVSLVYGGSLGGSGHAEHGVLVWPSVAPMNAHEIRSSARVDVNLGHSWGTQISGFGAAPLGTGAFIALMGSEVTYALGRFTLGVGARHGLASHTTGLVFTSSIMGMF